MRILISTDTVGGVWNYTATLATGLEAEGHDVMVAVIGRVSDGRAAMLPAAVEMSARQFRLEWMNAVDAEIEAAGTWLVELAETWQPDVLHLNQFAYASARFGAPTLVVAHSDVLSWFSEVRGSAAPQEWARYASWVQRGLHAADCVVSPTEYKSGLLERHYGRSADRVIHNGVEPPPVSETPKEPLAVSAGRAWDEGKGMAVLDEALSGGDAPVVPLLGETRAPEGGSFVPENLVAHGRVERQEMDSWLDRASVYIAPSLYEPFGLAPLEAAFHGCALLLSDIGSFRELWDGAAEFFPTGDSRALRRGLDNLLSERNQCESRGREARKRAERYTAERMVEGYLDLYGDLQQVGATCRSTAGVR